MDDIGSTVQLSSLKLINIFIASAVMMVRVVNGCFPFFSLLLLQGGKVAKERKKGGSGGAGRESGPE